MKETTQNDRETAKGGNNDADQDIEQGNPHRAGCTVMFSERMQ